jgi:hypothetical protein
VNDNQQRQLQVLGSLFLVIFISVDDSRAIYFVLAAFLCWSAAQSFVGLGFGPTMLCGSLGSDEPKSAKSLYSSLMYVRGSRSNNNAPSGRLAAGGRISRERGGWSCALVESDTRI